VQRNVESGDQSPVHASCGLCEKRMLVLPTVNLHSGYLNHHMHIKDTVYLLSYVGVSRDPVIMSPSPLKFTKSVHGRR